MRNQPSEVELAQEIAADKGFTVHLFEAGEMDHIHCFVSAPPKLSITDIVKYAKKNNSPEIMKLVGYLMSVYDFGSLGGAIILGAGKPIIKARGSAKPEAVVNTAAMLLNMAKNRDVFYGKDER